jgi:hypothetical protein
MIILFCSYICKHLHFLLYHTVKMEWGMCVPHIWTAKWRIHPLGRTEIGFFDYVLVCMHTQRSLKFWKIKCQYLSIGHPVQGHGFPIHFKQPAKRNIKRYNVDLFIYNLMIMHLLQGSYKHWMRCENHYEYRFGREYYESCGIFESTIQVFVGKAMENLCWAAGTRPRLKLGTYFIRHSIQSCYQ